jgi:mono/diheme cytochrome c family protein
LVSACAGIPLPRESLTTPGGLLFNGYTRLEINCYECHSGNGEGTWRGGRLTNQIPKMSDDEIVLAIDKGRHWMPSFRDKLSSEEKQQLVTWLRSQFGTASNPR